MHQPDHPNCPCPRCTYIMRLVDMAQSINWMGVQGIGMPDGPPPNPFANGPNLPGLDVPICTDPPRKELEQALGEALAQEEYEVAAELRDALKKHQNTSC